MPLYEYACTSCGHRLEVIHGIHASGPAECPSCGAAGTMRKGFAPPAVHFKGSGWAKKDRRSASASKSKADSGDGEAAASGAKSGGGSDAGGDAGKGSGSGSSAKAKEPAAGSSASTAAPTSSGD